MAKLKLAYGRWLTYVRSVASISLLALKLLTLMYKLIIIQPNYKVVTQLSFNTHSCVLCKCVSGVVVAL